MCALWFIRTTGYLLGAGLDVLACAVAAHEDTGSLDDQVNALHPHTDPVNSLIAADLPAGSVLGDIYGDCAIVYMSAALIISPCCARAT